MQLLQQQQQQQLQQQSNTHLLTQQQLMHIQQQQQLMQLQQQQQNEQRRRAQTVGNASQLPQVTSSNSTPMSLPFPAQTLSPQQLAALGVVSPAFGLIPSVQPLSASPQLTTPNPTSEASATPSAMSVASPVNPPTLQPESTGNSNDDIIQKLIAQTTNLDEAQRRQFFEQFMQQQPFGAVTSTASESSIESTTSTSTLAPQSASVDSAASTARASSTNHFHAEPDHSIQSKADEEQVLVIADEEENPVVD